MQKNCNLGQRHTRWKMAREGEGKGRGDKVSKVMGLDQTKSYGQSKDFGCYSE